MSQDIANLDSDPFTLCSNWCTIDVRRQKATSRPPDTALGQPRHQATGPDSRWIPGDRMNTQTVALHPVLGAVSAARESLKAVRDVQPVFMIPAEKEAAVTELARLEAMVGE